MASSDIRISRRGAGFGAAVAVVVVAAMMLSVVVALQDDGTPTVTASEPAPETTSTTAADTTTAPERPEITCTNADGDEIPCLAENELNQVAQMTPRMSLGWGAAQPNQMSATVQEGSTDDGLSPERRKILGDNLAAAREAALEIGTVGEAERLGFVKNWEWVEGRGYEYVHWGRFTDELDLSMPTLLVAADDKPDSPIVSMAYNVLGSREDGPPDGFPLEYIPWHYHHNLCRVGDSVIGNVETREDGTLYEEAAKRCIEAGATYQPELDHWMVDLWVIPGWENPWGLVSSKHPDLFREPVPWFEDDEADQPAS